MSRVDDSLMAPSPLSFRVRRYHVLHDRRSSNVDVAPERLLDRVEAIEEPLVFDNATIADAMEARDTAADGATGGTLLQRHLRDHGCAIAIHQHELHGQCFDLVALVQFLKTREHRGFADASAEEGKNRNWRVKGPVD